MKATSVSIPTARKLGKLLTATLLLLTACMPNQGAETIITVTGTLNGGHDYLGIFGLGPNMHAGTPYTLVFTIDDTKGGEMRQSCPLAVTGISGFGQNNPVTGILTINGKSYEFGQRPDVRSSAWRNVASVCSDSEIGIKITEGRAPLEMGVSIRVNPKMGTRSLTQERDWRKPISLTNVQARNTYNEFGITRSKDEGGTHSYLSVDSVTVGRKE